VAEDASEADSDDEEPGGLGPDEVDAGAEGGAEDGDGDGDDVSAGPSVFVPAGAFVPPQEDIKLLDARQLVVQGKVTEEAEADKAQSTVSAFARVHNTKVRKGIVPMPDSKDSKDYCVSASS
jgi:hypothetical protein